MLKSLFPLSFNTTDVSKLIVKLLIYIAASIVVSFTVKLFGWIPIIGAFVWLVASLINLYILAGIIITILNYLKVVE